MKTRTNIYLTQPQIEALKALSNRTELSHSEMCRRAIDEYLAKQKRIETISTKKNQK